MVEVIKNEKLYLSFANKFLHFEWTVDKSDMSVDKPPLRSSKFDIGGEYYSHLKLLQCACGKPRLLLYNCKSVQKGLFLTIISDKNDKVFYSVIKRVYPSSNSGLTFVDLIPIFCEPSPAQYPIKISVTIRANAENLSEVNSSRCNEGFDFKSILGLDVNTDIVMRVGEENIKAHKVILEANSPVFRRMFAKDHDLVEIYVDKIKNFASNLVHTLECFHNNAMRCVFGAAYPHFDFAAIKPAVNRHKLEIPDVKPATMVSLLKLLYSKKIDCTPAEMLELYQAADRYEFLSLRDGIDLSKFTDLIDLENACDLFIIANRHQHEELKKTVVEFVSDNFMSVINSESFSKMNKKDIIILMRLSATAMIK